MALVLPGPGRGPRRPLTLLALGATAVPCAILCRGGGGQRLLPGAVGGQDRWCRAAGRARPGGRFQPRRGASLTGRPLAEAPHFAAACVILVLAVPAAVAGRPPPRVPGVFAAARMLSAGCAPGFGTPEEQRLYLAHTRRAQVRARYLAVRWALVNRHPDVSPAQVRRPASQGAGAVLP